MAAYAAELCRAGRSGAASDAAVEVSPQGEAVAYRAMAAAARVPDEAMLPEPEATNSGANIQLSRRVLAAAGIVPTTVALIAMPYMQRRAYATCRRQRPEVDVVSLGLPISLADYLAGFANPRRSSTTWWATFSGIIEYPDYGYTIEQEVPEDVRAALKRLIAAGFDSRLIKPKQLGS